MPLGLTPQVRTKSPGPARLRMSACPGRAPTVAAAPAPHAPTRGAMPSTTAVCQTGESPRCPGSQGEEQAGTPQPDSACSGVPQTKAAHYDQPQALAVAPALATLSCDPETQGQGRPESWETGLAAVQAGHVSPVTPASPAQPPHGSLCDVEPAVGGRECPSQANQRMPLGSHGNCCRARLSG